MITALILAAVAVLTLHCTEEGTSALVAKVKTSPKLQVAAGVTALLALITAGPLAVALAALVGFGGAKLRTKLRTAV